MRKFAFLYFDDYPLQSENALLVERLLRHGKGQAHIEKALTIRSVEEKLKAMHFDLAILDIMARVPKDFISVLNGEPVSSALAGVEILRRCRSGYYGSSKKIMPIFIRTARGEPHIRRVCFHSGADGFFLVGNDDDKLIRRFREILKEFVDVQVNEKRGDPKSSEVIK